MYFLGNVRLTKNFAVLTVSRESKFVVAKGLKILSIVPLRGIQQCYVREDLCRISTIFRETAT